MGLVIIQHPQATNNNNGVNGINGGIAGHGGHGIVAYRVTFSEYDNNSSITVTGGKGGTGGRGEDGQRGSNGLQSP